MEVLLTIFTLGLAGAFFNEEIKARRQERSWDEYWAKYEAEQAPRLLEERRIKLKMCVDNEF